MVEPRTIVERELGRVDVRPFTLDTFHSRRERKRRDQRLAAGALGISIALAIALVASQVAVQRDRTGGAPTARNGSIAFITGRGISLSGPGGTNSHVAVRKTDPLSDCLDGERACDFNGLSWSPDGTRLAFVFGEPSVVFLGNTSVYVMDAATEEVRLLARCPAAPGDPAGTCDDRNPLSWSPDGERIVISSWDRLFLVDAASGDLTQITGCGSCSYQGPAAEPTWSPDGDRIAFTGNDMIISVAVDGSARQTLVRSADAGISINGARPRWSPDGSRLAFVADEGMYVVNADGSGLRLLVNHNPSIAFPSPSWSPDGRQLVYLETSGSGDVYRAEIRVVDVTGEHDRVLYRSGCCIDDWRSPVFAPDGTKIAFSLGVENSFFVFVMDADGGDVHRTQGFGEVAWQALPR